MENLFSRNKNLKILFPVIILVLISSCTSTDNQLQSQVIGDWGVFVSMSDGETIQCNSCPIIKFTDKKTATLIKPNNDKEYYNWNLEENALILKSQNDKTSNNYFNNSKFEIEITKKEKFIELKLLTSKNSGYILRK